MGTFPTLPPGSAVLRAAPGGGPLPDVDPQRLGRIADFHHLLPSHAAGLVAPQHLPDGGEYVAAPEPDQELTEGLSLLLIGLTKDLAKLEKR